MTPPPPPSGNDGSVVVKMAVVSTAEIARNKVVPAILHVQASSASASTKLKLIGVSSRNKERAEEFIKKYCSCNNDDDDDSSTTTSSAIRGMTNDEVLLLDKNDVDAIYVPLPSKVRNECITKALRAGKHVYSEKPAGGTISEFKQIIDLSVSQNLQFMDGTMWYHSNRTKSMERALFGDNDNDDNDCTTTLGSVRRVSASFTWGGGGLVDNDWVEGGNGRTDPSNEKFGMLGDSGHYPISAVSWAFRWELPIKVCATYTKFNSIGAIVECEACLWYTDGRRAVIDASCLLPHRSQFEVVCENGVIKVDDLVGGQARSGNFSDAYEHPYVGSSSYVVGDHLGKDTTISNFEPCDHAQCLVEEFTKSVQSIISSSNNNGTTTNTTGTTTGKANSEWGKRALCTHIVMCAIYESAMRNGTDVELVTTWTSSDDGVNNDAKNEMSTTKFIIDGETYNDLPTK